MGSSLGDPERLRAVRELGLDAGADARLDRLADRLRTVLGVPVAVIALVEADRQVFPGQSGWGATRETPVSHAFSRHVVDTAEPLVVVDARTDPRTAGNPAIDDFGVLAFAGYPLVDGAGCVLGAVCAIDRAPHDWTAEELAEVWEVAEACSTEVQLRLARSNAEVERAKTGELRELLTRSLRRSQLLLSASRALSNVASVNELRDRIADLMAGDLAPASVELIITEHLDAQSVSEDLDGGPVGELIPRTVRSGQWHNFDQQGPGVVARAVRGRHPVHYPDLRAHAPGLTPDVRQAYLDRGLVAVVCAPILKDDRVLGVLEVAWDEPHEAGSLEQAAVAVIAGYVAVALEGARYVQRRISVADELQRAMLTSLPTVPGLTLAASYVPAAISERVGGDWYDAFVLPAPQVGTAALVVGDVSGHDMAAATVMGQLRAMLRQAAWHVGSTGSPAGAMTALDQATCDLAVGTLATVVLGFLRPPTEDSPSWSMTWTNAGHPPPIVVGADGTAFVLDSPQQHDHLIGAHPLIDDERRDHHLTLAPGSTVLFYTDGLIERRDRDLDASIADLAERLTRFHDAEPQTIPAKLVGELWPDAAPDDITLLVVRVD